MNKEQLANTLREFYKSARQLDGKHYQKQSLINIRSSINRYLQQPPFNSTWNLMHDAEFTSANRTFSGNYTRILLLWHTTTKFHAVSYTTSISTVRKKEANAVFLNRSPEDAETARLRYT